MRPSQSATVAAPPRPAALAAATDTTHAPAALACDPITTPAAVAPAAASKPATGNGPPTFALAAAALARTRPPRRPLHVRDLSSLHHQRPLPATALAATAGHRHRPS